MPVLVFLVLENGGVGLYKFKVQEVLVHIVNNLLVQLWIYAFIFFVYKRKILIILPSVQEVTFYFRLEAGRHLVAFVEPFEQIEELQ